MRRLLAIVIVVLAAAAIAAWYRVPRALRLPSYTLDLRLPRPDAAARPPALLRAGVGTADITPEVGPDRPPIWLAGFRRGRRATGVHDPLLARAVVLDDGRSRVAIVALDLIGHFHDETALARAALPAELGVDYLAVASLHNHNSPDAMGLWGPHLLRSGVDPAYLARVRAACVAAVRDAVAALGPARLVAAEADLAADDLIRDSRPPVVIDARALAVALEDPTTGRARATIVLWSNHPEALGSKNTLVTSDFPHYVRRAVERETGAPCVYLSGAVGGLMTPLDRPARGLDGRVHAEDSFEKAEAIGEVVARRALDALAAEGARRADAPAIACRARTVEVVASNRLYWLAMKLGVIDRGLTSDGRVRTEVAALRVGPVALALVPGELYPEIAKGGVESPPGADFPGEPAERPPLLELLARAAPDAPVRGVVGLANDELGYIIPRTQWDADAPHAYGLAKAPYGEVNSLGPLAGPELHRALARVIEELPR